MKRQLLHALNLIAPRFSLGELVRRSKQNLFLPFYHTVKDKQNLDHIKHLYRVRTVAQFEQDMDYLLKHFRPIDLHELEFHLLSKKPFEEKVFFLSFDDGLRGVLETASPILQKKEIPATVFLNSAFVDNNDLFYRYKTSLLIEQISKHPLSKNQLKTSTEIFGNENSIKESLLNVNYSSRLKLDKFATLIEYDFNSFLEKEKPYLTSEEIKTMSENGFTFGGHSIDHPEFKNLSFEQQIHQCTASRAFIKKLLHPTTNPFAFPFSDEEVSDSFFDKINEDNNSCLTFGISGIKQDPQPLHLQRFPMEKSELEAEKQIPTAYLYYLVKQMFGKASIER